MHTHMYLHKNYSIFEDNHTLSLHTIVNFINHCSLLDICPSTLYIFKITYSIYVVIIDHFQLDNYIFFWRR